MRYQMSAQTARDFLAELDREIKVVAELGGNRTLVAKFGAETPHVLRLSLEEAQSMAAAIRDQLARMAGQPLGKTEVITRDESGEIVRVDTTFRY